MTNRAFVHLHNHSEYSLLDGSCRLEELVRRTREFGQPAVAITDHGNLFGALKFYKAARAAGVKPIIGVEAYMAPGSRHQRGGAGPGIARKPYSHMILLARNLTGYANLLTLVSKSYTEGFYYRPRMDRDLLAAHAEGLIGTSGCLSGEIPQLLLAGRKADAEKLAMEYAGIFGPEHFYLEIQDQGIPDEQTLLPHLAELSTKTGLPLLATNDCHYMNAEDHFAHDVLICIQTGKTIGEPRSLHFTEEHYYKSSAEMWKRFGEYPSAMENTVRVAELCDLTLSEKSYQLPEFQGPSGITAEDYFQATVKDGYEERLIRWKQLEASGELRHPLDDYSARLKREIDCITKMGFAGYFLIVWDLVHHARQKKIPVGPGRGSAAGSLVAYCLRITDIDPLQYDLLFERFLNPERVSMPDIDIDFCINGRPRMIEYVTGKYGRENVAQIITFGTMAARAAIRDVGRGLNIPFAQVDRIAKLIPPSLDATVSDALSSVPELKKRYQEEVEIKRLLDVASRLEGLPRHASTHAAGVVIAPAPITKFAPLYQGREGEITTQYSMGDIESIGLLKMDFLGLKTLTLIDSILKWLRTAEGRTLDLAALGVEDKATYELFSRGGTSGIFQFESDGMRDILRKLQPERFEDLIALNALYRPGPLLGGLVDDFIKRRHGKVKVDYIVDELKEILAETYGVIVYQEQVMKIASELGGFSLGQADLLRRAMGKKDADLLAAQKKLFLKGTERRGISARNGENIFKQMEFFAGYGFNKSHSAAYALIAYRTAYLKCHHPLGFMAALLTSEHNNTDKLVTYINECKEMNIEVLPPDINLSQPEFIPEGESIRFGLAAVKNAGAGAIDAVIRARGQLGEIKSLESLVKAVDLKQVNKRVFEALVKSGSMDSMFPVRARLMATLDGALEVAQKARQDRELGQGSLFAGQEAPSPVESALADVPPWSDHETLAFEKESLGFYMSGHPLSEFAEEIKEFGTHDSKNLRHAEGGERVSLAGMIAAIRKRKTRKGDWMAVLTLEDLEGILEVVIFPSLLSLLGPVLIEDNAVLVTGRVESQAEGERGRIIAEEVLALADAHRQKVSEVVISLDATGLDEALLLRLRQILKAHEGAVPVVFQVTQAAHFRARLQPEALLGVCPRAAFKKELADLLGPGHLKLRLSRGRSGRKSPVFDTQAGRW